MRFRLRLLAIALGLSLLSGAAGAGQDTSHWAQGMRSAVRLIAGAPAGEGAYEAGVEIRLAPGTVTYWRHPGDAGVPPVFRFDGSVNLGKAEVLYPAPARLDEGGSEIFGYKDKVVFPVKVTARDRMRPVELVLNLDYAVCEKICIPAQAEARLVLDPGDAGAEAARVKAALTRVPVARPLADTGRVAVVGVNGLGLNAARQPVYRVDVRVPAGAAAADLFAETGTGFFIETAKAAPGPDGHPAFTATVVEQPAAGSGRLPVVFTLTAGDAAIETRVMLDLPAPMP